MVASLARPCPYCDAPVEGPACPSCQRSPTSPRRVCRGCGKMTPADERACCRCGAVATSELAWKVPLIIAIFVVGIAIAVALQLAR